MRIQIYISDDFSETYMPFLLFREACRSVLSQHEGVSGNIEYITHISHICNTPDTIVLLNMYDVTLYDGKEFVLQTIFQSTAHFLVVNTEHWETRGAKSVIEKLQQQDVRNIMLVEYNIINYENIQKSYNRVRMLFLPLLYDPSIESYYSNNIEGRRIAWGDKDIDVLFYGSINERRQHIIDELKLRWNVCVIDSHHGATNKELCQYIERSKVVINVLYYDFNIIFDYYRNTLLLSNNVVLVSEQPTHMNVQHEYWLENMKDNSLFTEYSSMVSMIDHTLSKSESEIARIVTQQYEWFSRVTMSDILVPFFTYFQIQQEFCDTA